MVLRWLGSETPKFGLSVELIMSIDHRTETESCSFERYPFVRANCGIVVGLYTEEGATLLVGTWSHEKQE